MIATVKDLINELEKFDPNMPVRSGRQNTFRSINLVKIVEKGIERNLENDVVSIETY
jgi:hypothetical protein